MAKKSTQEPVWGAKYIHSAVCSQATKNRVLEFLSKEKELDAQNYQEMLNKVDLTTLTKAKITALGKLGKQYLKSSNTLMKKYRDTKVNSTIGSKHKWIEQNHTN